MHEIHFTYMLDHQLFKQPENKKLVCSVSDISGLVYRGPFCFGGFILGFTMIILNSITAIVQFNIHQTINIQIKIYYVKLDIQCFLYKSKRNAVYQASLLFNCDYLQLNQLDQLSSLTTNVNSQNGFIKDYHFTRCCFLIFLSGTI